MEAVVGGAVRRSGRDGEGDVFRGPFKKLSGLGAPVHR